MKAILMSIQPQWVEKILNGKKTIEIRKTRPKLERPLKVYIYCTKGKECIWTGKTYSYTKEVVGEFTCDNVEQFTVGSLGCDDLLKNSCLSYEQLISYFYKAEELKKNITKYGYAYHISDLKIYDEPKQLSDFYYRLDCQKDGDFEHFACWESGCLCYEKGLCDGTGYMSLERPPMSWQYVEEIMEIKF